MPAWSAGRTGSACSSSGENHDFDHHPDQDCYVIAGTRGSLRVPTLRVYEYLGAASWWNPLVKSRVEIREIDPLARQLDHFCAVAGAKCRPASRCATPSARSR